MPAPRGRRPHNYRHGHTAGASSGVPWSATYRTWASMVQRCTLPGGRGWDNYGARGVSVCWRSFDAFLADMGQRPPGMTIDRIDNSRGYEPGNCRWATRGQQAQNRRTTRLTAETATEALGRLEHGEGVTSIARRLGVSIDCIKDLRAGRTWRQLEPPGAFLWRGRLRSGS